MTIEHSPAGYYTLFIDGKFFGNFDTYSEAEREYVDVASVELL